MAATTNPNCWINCAASILILVSKEAKSSAKLGLNNPAIIGLRNQKAQLLSEVKEEVQHLKKDQRE